MRGAHVALALLLALPLSGRAADGAGKPTPPVSGGPATTYGSRTGLDIYRRFREGLAEPACRADASTRWQAHFAHAPSQLAAPEGELLPLFGYVVDAMREAHLPTEFALIPFVESGYKPGARSAQGPVGMWQMIAVTARNHKVPMRPGYDGRLSPIDSTTAAVRYLKTLHGMFAGDWRLAVMAYNAGEYRILGALKRGGQVARDAQPEKLPGLSPITHAYVRKLHALSCLLEQADDRDEWLRALDRPVPVLQAFEVPAGVADIATWAKRNTANAGHLRRLNPVYADGRLPGSGAPRRLLAPIPGTRVAPVSAGAALTSADANAYVAELTPPPEDGTLGRLDLSGQTSGALEPPQQQAGTGAADAPVTLPAVP